jgi:hemerythrin-like domain-containing protein
MRGEGKMGERKDKSSKEEMEEEISPVEDLMREHGVLNRILLIYEDAVGKLKSDRVFPMETLSGAARIIRRFIEDYHEKLEEDYLFPKFEKAGMMVDLVATLRSQHEAGRRLTDDTVHLLTNQRLKNLGDRKKLIDCLEQFICMYRPHAAREDTVLFPVLRKIVSSSEFDSLGEEFEEKEHQFFGENGFTEVVEKVAQLEKSIGLFDLSRFTPHF